MQMNATRSSALEAGCRPSLRRGARGRSGDSGAARDPGRDAGEGVCLALAGVPLSGGVDEHGAEVAEIRRVLGAERFLVRG